MKRWIILAALVVVISATATVLVQYLPAESSIGAPSFPVASVPKGEAPVLVVKEKVLHDFGKRAQHEKLKYDWTIRNEGKGDLILHLQSTTCSCTVAEFPKQANSDSIRVKPGEETAIHLTFDTKSNEGAYSQSATVGTNDPSQPLLVLAAKAEVHPAIILVPPEKYLNFASIPNDTDHKARIALYSPDRPKLKVLGVKTTKPGLVVAEVDPMTALERAQLKAEGGHRLIVTIKPGLPLGLFHEQVKITTDHPKQPEVVLDVAGRVVGPIVVTPERIDLPNISGRTGGQGELTIMVRGFRDTKFEVDKQPEKVDVSIAPAGDANKAGRYRLTVKVPPGTTPGQIHDLLVLKTDHPQASVVKIPVNILVNGPK